MKKRIITTVLIVVSVIIMPYWFYLPVLFLAVIIFPFYWEGLLVVFFIDVIYGSGFGLGHLFSPLVISVLVALAISILFRDNIRLTHV